MTQAAIDASRYPHPGFAPVHDELTTVALQIKGKLPESLNGLFLRNGPNALYPLRKPHMFDGSAMVHAIEIKNGEARYSNFLVHTPLTSYIKARGNNPYLGFGEMTSASKSTLFRLLLQQFKGRLGIVKKFEQLEGVVSSTAIMHYNDRLYCLQETGLPFALDAVRGKEGWLTFPGTGRLEDFDGALSAPFSAHPKTDIQTGEVHSIGQYFSKGRTEHTVLHADGQAKSTVIYEGKSLALFAHDLILTDNYIVFLDTSLRFDAAGLASRGSIVHFDHKHNLRFGVISRHHKAGNAVQWFETALPGHIWHIINGWEESGCIKIYAPVFRDYPDTVPIHTPAEPHTDLMFWSLDIASGRVVEEDILLKHHYERPGIDTRYAGKKTRYAWLLDEGRGGIMGKGVLKYDLINRAESGYVDYADMFGGEPLYVPDTAAGSDAEDSGFILDLLSNAERSELLVLDAKSMTECCRIELPRRVPFGVHGIWLNRAEVEQLSGDGLSR